jgi:hypothetical protein
MIARSVVIVPVNDGAGWGLWESSSQNGIGSASANDFIVTGLGCRGKGNRTSIERYSILPNYSRYKYSGFFKY